MWLVGLVVGWVVGWLVGWLVLWVIKDMGVGEWGGVYSIYLVGDLVGGGWFFKREE